MAQASNEPVTAPGPQVPIAPLPTVISIGADDQGHVLLRVSDPGGVRFAFLAPAQAVTIGETMAALGRKMLLAPATKRLVVATTNGKRRR